MYQLRTEIEIDTNPMRVWEVLTDGEEYRAWNPFVRRLKGKLAKGENLFVIMTPPGKKAYAFKPKVLSVDEGKALTWRGHLGVPGLFDGEHHFEVHPVEGGRSRFVQWEKFTGLLVPLTKKILEENTKQGFESMNRALKWRAETNGQLI